MSAKRAIHAGSTKTDKLSPCFELRGRKPIKYRSVSIGRPPRNRVCSAVTAFCRPFSPCDSHVPRPASVLNPGEGAAKGLDGGDAVRSRDSRNLEFIANSDELFWNKLSYRECGGFLDREFRRKHVYG